MILEIQAHGMNVHESPWIEVTEHAFGEVVEPYTEAITALRIVIEALPSTSGIHRFHCHATVSLRDWPSFEVTERAADEQRAIESAAGTVRRTLEVILRR